MWTIKNSFAATQKAGTVSSLEKCSFWEQKGDYVLPVVVTQSIAKPDTIHEKGNLCWLFPLIVDLQKETEKEGIFPANKHCDETEQLIDRHALMEEGR